LPVVVDTARGVASRTAAEPGGAPAQSPVVLPGPGLALGGEYGFTFAPRAAKRDRAANANESRGPSLSLLRHWASGVAGRPSLELPYFRPWTFWSGLLCAAFFLTSAFYYGAGPRSLAGGIGSGLLVMAFWWCLVHLAIAANEGNWRYAPYAGPLLVALACAAATFAVGRHAGLRDSAAAWDAGDAGVMAGLVGVYLLDTYQAIVTMAHFARGGQRGEPRLIILTLLSFRGSDYMDARVADVLKSRFGLPAWYYRRAAPVLILLLLIEAVLFGHVRAGAAPILLMRDLWVVLLLLLQTIWYMSSFRFLHNQPVAAERA
jgi:hypothetical protein